MKYLAEEIVSRCSSWPCCRGGNTIFWILSLGVDLIQSSIEGEHTSGLEVMEVSAAALGPEDGRVGGCGGRRGSAATQLQPHVDWPRTARS